MQQLTAETIEGLHSSIDKLKADCQQANSQLESCEDELSTANDQVEEWKRKFNEKEAEASFVRQ